MLNSFKTLDQTVDLNDAGRADFWRSQNAQLMAMLKENCRKYLPAALLIVFALVCSVVDLQAVGVADNDSRSVARARSQDIVKSEKSGARILEKARIAKEKQFQKTQKRRDKLGYLVSISPSPIRFSDELSANKRPPSPALPEFSLLSQQYDPYLIEQPIPEDMLREMSHLSEVVIELEPHEVVSGIIDTSYADEIEEKLNQLDLDENRVEMVRPEEVLIFFEAESKNGKTSALVPFSPATPSTQTIKSSAKYIKE